MSEENTQALIMFSAICRVLTDEIRINIVIINDENVALSTVGSVSGLLDSYFLCTSMKTIPLFVLVIELSEGLSACMK